MLQIKNPWGKVEVSDEHSYKFAHLDNPDFKSKLENKLAAPVENNKDEGIFFIEFDEYKEHFDDLSISL